ncbi:MAG TPA: adenylate/guanylate cyclase domain-containing protein [Methylomirabilota bacterium]|nr:adenylate/guanylate cyclase domain-containing protein [Methylomirabilota bacterium]
MLQPDSSPVPRLRSSLKLKLGLLITGLLVTAVVLLSSVLLYSAERSLLGETTKRGHTIAQHLANAARNPLLTKDELTLNLLVKEAMKDGDLVYVVITDHQGKVVAHTDVDQLGRGFERAAGLAALGPEPVVQSYRSAERGRILDFAIPLTFRRVNVGAVYVGISQKSVDDAISQARNRLLGLSFAIVVIGLAGSLALATLLTRPILRLVEGTRRITAGDFTVNLAVSSRDEIGVLTEAFNTMATHLGEKEMIKQALARYVDRDVADELLKDPGQLVLEGERREVTVLFCDLRGFTPLSERLAPEEVVLLLNQFYDLMIEATFRNQGSIDKFLGDAVMAVFGAPIAHPNHALRAVRTALAMREGIELLSRRRIRRGGEPLTVGIGVSTGETVAGTVGTDDRMEYTVVGDSVNVAARLESIAKPMQILISARTWREVKDAVKARPLGGVRVRGKEEEIEAHEVLQLR